MPPNPGYRFTRDGGLIIHPSLATATDNAMSNPTSDATSGAGFADPISNDDREFMVHREPICYFLVYGVAADISEKWFKVNDPDTEEADPALDRSIQEQFAILKFKSAFTKSVGFERLYGWSLIVGAFTDAKNSVSLKLPLAVNAELMQLNVYPKTKVRVVQTDWNPMSMRFGQPVVYELNRGNGVLTDVHFTRCILVKSRGEITSNALVDAVDTDSVLDVVWDDMTCGRNIRWGAGQWMYRTGSGFACIGFPAGTTVDQLEAWSSSGAFSGIMNRTYIGIAQNSVAENTGMTFDFKGVSGVALDPTPFFKTNIEQIAVATGIPQAKLVGAQAGALTGSEVNMQDYYKVISRCQSALEDVVRWVIDRLADSGQIKLVTSSTATDYRHKTAQSYEVEWNSAFELSEAEEATIEDLHVRANQGKLDYMSKDEVRADDGLDPLPNGAGEWKDAPQGLQLFGEKGIPNDPKNPQAKGNMQNKQENPLEKQLNNSDMFITFAPKQPPQKVKDHEHTINP